MRYMRDGDDTRGEQDHDETWYVWRYLHDVVGHLVGQHLLFLDLIPQALGSDQRRNTRLELCLCAHVLFLTLSARVARGAKA